jgi:ABC-type multidrug transport system fused ATPase/permease subunit
MARVFELELSTARRFPTGDLLSRIFNDVAAVGDFVENGIRRLIGDGVLAAGSLAMMFLLQWKLALSACLIVPALGLVGVAISRSIRAWGARAQRAIGELAATSSEQLQGLTTIKGYQAEEFERRRFADRNASYRKKILRTEWWASFLVGTVFLVTGLSLVGAVAYLSRLVTSQRLTAGDLLAFCLFGIAVRAIRRLPRCRAYSGVVARQTRLLGSIFRERWSGPACGRTSARRATWISTTSSSATRAAAWSSTA